MVRTAQVNHTEQKPAYPTYWQQDLLGTAKKAAYVAFIFLSNAAISGYNMAGQAATYLRNKGISLLQYTSEMLATRYKTYMNPPTNSQNEPTHTENLNSDVILLTMERLSSTGEGENTNQSNDVTPEASGESSVEESDNEKNAHTPTTSESSSDSEKELNRKTIQKENIEQSNINSVANLDNNVEESDSEKDAPILTASEPSVEAELNKENIEQPNTSSTASLDDAEDSSKEAIVEELNSEKDVSSPIASEPSSEAESEGENEVDSFAAKQTTEELEQIVEAQTEEPTEIITENSLQNRPTYYRAALSVAAFAVSVIVTTAVSYKDQLQGFDINSFSVLPAFPILP